MEFQIKNLPKSQIEIEIKISASEFRVFVEKAIFQLGENIKVEGFRQGKVPKKIIEDRVGQDRILKEATESAIKQNYLKVISENKIEAIGNPEIEIPAPPKISGELFLKVRVSVLPKISLPDYKKIALGCKENKVSVEAKEIDDALLWLQRSRAKFSQISRPAQKGDFIEIEFSAPNIENGSKQKDAFLLGQGRLIPGLEDPLEGMESGEEKKISVEFPSGHFQKELAGQKINFEVKMLSVQKMEPPEVNDQFARSLGAFENLAALKENILRGLTLEKETQEKQKLRQGILEKIVKEVSWEIPDILIESEKQRMLEELKKEVNNKLQISFEEYLKRANQTEEQLLLSLQQGAEQRIKGSLALNKISLLENIQVPEDEIKAEVNKILSRQPSTEKAKKELDLEKLKLYIENELRNEKTFRLLENFALK